MKEKGTNVVVILKNPTKMIMIFRCPSYIASGMSKISTKSIMVPTNITSMLTKSAKVHARIVQIFIDISRDLA